MSSANATASSTAAATGGKPIGERLVREPRSAATTAHGPSSDPSTVHAASGSGRVPPRDPPSVGSGPGAPPEGRGQKARSLLRKTLGEEVFQSWFNTFEIDAFDGRIVRASVPQKFLVSWIQSHYSADLLACCRVEFPGAERVEVVLRQPGDGHQRNAATMTARQGVDGDPQSGLAGPMNGHAAARPHGASSAAGSQASGGFAGLPSRAGGQSSAHRRPTTGVSVSGQTGGLEGSPLDPRYTFDSFVVGAGNGMAHTGAMRVAEGALDQHHPFNPFYIHAPVGLGKSHLLQAIASEVKRRTPGANVLYLTAERFRYQFVEALRRQDPMAFKDRFLGIDVLLIDDLEFLHGQQTELEFDHIINTLLDGGRQVVVASARAPGHIEKLKERMRSRLQRGLVTEIGALDYDLRLRILQRRVVEKQEAEAGSPRQADRPFDVPRDVLELLAKRLTESGRELEGAVTRLHAMWQYTRTPITVDLAQTIIRDLVQGLEPRRIKIEDILKVVSRHFGVSKGDILSERRHRSIVWPRQVGMYLAKQLTTRSLPEIGRRFGDRDHTTVIHAIRKIEGELEGNVRLRDELEELKKMLAS